ncbi:MAG TPA: GNAT family N-acetyltransferase [Gemmatimonadales bacterium]|nr:GNAT family N-acetyltransferase [Gemmatimonadales bacterium]
MTDATSSGLPALDAFTTARLRAERLTPEHLSEIRRMHRDPAVMRHLGGVRDDAETAVYLARNLQHWADYGFGLWILRERGGGEPIGRAVLRHLLVDAVDEIEVGYAFYQPFWGQGLATEVTLACLALGRRELTRTSFVAVTRPSNLASQRVLQKAGLAYEREVIHGGEPHCLFRTT